MRQRIAVFTGGAAIGILAAGTACSLLASPDDLVGSAAVDSSIALDGTAQDATDTTIDSAPAADDAADAGTAAVPQTLAQDEPGPTSIAATTAGEIYWLNAATRQLHSLGKDGGAPLSYLPSDAGTAYAPKTVFADTAGATVFVPAVRPAEQSPCVSYRTNGSPTLECGAWDNAGVYKAGAMNATSVFYLIEQCGQDSACLARRPSSGTPKRMEYTDLIWTADRDAGLTSAPGPMAYDTASLALFFFSSNAGTWTLQSLASAASAPKGPSTRILSDTLPVRAMGVDAKHVYWVTSTGVLKRVAKNAADAGTGEIIGSITFANPVDLVVGSQAVFVTDQGDGSVHAIRLDDGTHTVLAKGEAAPSGIALSPTSVVWANTADGKIRSLPIP